MGRSETVERQLKRFQLEAEISASGRRFCAWLDRGEAGAYIEICADLSSACWGALQILAKAEGFAQTRFGYLAGGFFVGHVVADVETLLPEALTTR
jgi:hypothetical protein